MDANATDLAVGSVFLFFTGVETVSLDTTFEIISKFGVVAVLWFWLKDMRKQMQDQLKTYQQHTEQLREEHREQVKHLSDMYQDYKNRLDKHLENNNKN